MAINESEYEYNSKDSK